MKRSWGATGVGEPEFVELSSGAKEQIKQIIQDHQLSNSDLDAFFNELDEGLSRFKEYASLRRKGLPANVRKNLKQTLKVSRTLNDCINELDGNSRQLLQEAAEGGLEAFRSHLSRMVKDINKALTFAGEYPRGGGRLPEHHRIFLAADVADAVKEILNFSPTSTPNGLFISILESVCAEAFGKEDPDVRELARKALSYPVKIRGAGGTVEYCLPPDTD